MRGNLDHLRRALMWEPRGHFDMYGCVPTPPVTPGADLGVLFLHVSGSGGVVNAGTVTFSVDGHSVSAAVDGNGDATARLTLPLQTAASLQSVDAVFSDPNLVPATATQTAVWELVDALLPSVATFAASGQSVQSFLFGQRLWDFLYTAQGR